MSTRRTSSASDFVNQKTYDLLVRGKAAAKENGCDIIQPSDLPITKGLQESIHEFRKIDEEIDLKSILENIATLPPLNLTYSYETAVLYDNHSPKGHHRHVEGVEEAYSFTDVDQLLADFMTHV